VQTLHMCHADPHWQTFLHKKKSDPCQEDSIHRTLVTSLSRLSVEVEASREAGSEEPASEGILSSTKLYIVIACIVALLFIALVQATCTIYRITRKPAQGTANKVRLNVDDASIFEKFQPYCICQESIMVR